METKVWPITCTPSALPGILIGEFDRVGKRAGAGGVGVEHDEAVALQFNGVVFDFTVRRFAGRPGDARAAQAQSQKRFAGELGGLGDVKRHRVAAGDNVEPGRNLLAVAEGVDSVEGAAAVEIKPRIELRAAGGVARSRHVDGHRLTWHEVVRPELRFIGNRVFVVREAIEVSPEAVTSMVTV